MKKKIVAAVAIASMISALTVGCSGSKELQNDYILIKQYKNLEIAEIQPMEITDEDVDRQIEAYQESYSVLHEITDRPAAEGDTVKVDFKGFVDGVAFEGGELEGAEMVLGGGNMIEGFHEGIYGRNPGEEFEIEVTFPDPYFNDPDLAGKPAVFEMTLHSISEKELPEVDDDFAKMVSESMPTMETVETVEELKQEFKTKQEEDAVEAAKTTMQNAAWEALLHEDNIEIKGFPDDMLKEKADELRETYKEYAESYGMEFEELMEMYFQASDEEGIDTAMLAEAERVFIYEMTFELISEKEKLTPSAKEIEEATEEYAEMHGFESSEEFLEQAGEDWVTRTMLNERVGEFLVDNATLLSEEEVAKRAEAAAAKAAEEEAAAIEEDATEEVADDANGEVAEEANEEAVEEDATEEMADDASTEE